MLNPKLYVFDIDGTLLTTDYKILPSTKEAISLLAKKDPSAPIMLASARSPRAIDPIAQELNLPPFYVSLNGALIVQNDAILYEQTMETGAAQRVREIAKEAGLSVNFYSRWDWFIEESNFWSTHEAKMVGWQGEIRDLRSVREVHKILLMGEQDHILKVQHALGQEMPGVSAHLSIPHYLEVVSADIDKGQALEIVSELLGVDFQHMVVFGDGENDLAMLKRGGFSVAMGNAHPNLKEVADYVTSSNDQDGILEAVLRILELGGVCC